MLKKIRLYQFRNFKTQTTVHLDRRHVILTGSNAQGKTNFLEAIYYLSFASSFKERRESVIAYWGSADFSVMGVYQDKNYDEKVLVKWQQEKKSIKINDVAIKDRKELIERYPCFVFCHDDIRLAEGEQESRRRFFDQLISFLDLNYINLLRNLKKVVKERNNSLRSGQRDLVELYTKQLVSTGFSINGQRAIYLELFNNYFKNLIKNFIGKEVDIVLQTSWKGSSEEEIDEYLKSKETYEYKKMSTLYGPHRDRYHFLFEGKEVSHYLSTGERRALSMALKITSAHMVAQMNRRKPILLIDDVLLELDPMVRKKVVHSLPAYEQAFFTFLPDDYFLKEMDNPLIYEVSEGQFLPYELPHQ